MQVKVRHGGIRWKETREIRGTEREVTEHAFRGMTVEIPTGEAKRLLKLKAVVPLGTELKLGGELSPVPDTASDSELIAWVSVANKDEILDEVKRRPALGDRILAAWDTVQEQLAKQNELLGGITPEIEEILANPPTDEDLIGAGAADGNGQGGGEGSDDPDEIVKGNVESVTKYLSEHPDQAQGILEAENRRAENATDERQKTPRVGVLAAVEAAAGHTQ